MPLEPYRSMTIAVVVESFSQTLRRNGLSVCPGPTISLSRLGRSVHETGPCGFIVTRCGAATPQAVTLSLIFRVVLAVWTSSFSRTPFCYPPGCWDGEMACTSFPILPDRQPHCFAPISATSAAMVFTPFAPEYLSGTGSALEEVPAVCGSSPSID